MSGIQTRITGIVRTGGRTKDLVKRLKPGEIAVINHDNLDPVAVDALVETKTKAVLNTGITVTGEYPNPGPEILLKKGIPIFEIKMEFSDGDRVKIDGNKVFQNGRFAGGCHLLTIPEIQAVNAKAEENLNDCLDSFIENTMSYAINEKSLILGNISLPPLKTEFWGRPVLVVTRGRDYKKDLQIIRSYIKEVKPVLVGVDGGADALREAGFIPHQIVGDMDSISEAGLKGSSELVVHAYPDGRAPGMERIRKAGCSAYSVSCPGTSEDLALLIAYQLGADLIITVGSHSSMTDFLEKGRRGMGSTFLVRLKIADKLVDAKGVSRLYRSRLPMSTFLLLLISAIIPGVLVLFFSPIVNHFLHLLILRINFLF